MDFARTLWLFLLIKPEELNSGNHVVNLRVSYVSILRREMVLFSLLSLSIKLA